MTKINFLSDLHDTQMSYAHCEKLNLHLILKYSHIEQVRLTPMQCTETE